MLLKVMFAIFVAVWATGHAVDKNGLVFSLKGSLILIQCLWMSEMHATIIMFL